VRRSKKQSNAAGAAADEKGYAEAVVGELMDEVMEVSRQVGKLRLAASQAKRIGKLDLARKHSIEADALEAEINAWMDEGAQLLSSPATKPPPNVRTEATEATTRVRPDDEEPK
jgi:hypothetical protein